ncbi:MAG: GntR family transcriptional regulator, partial [Lactovum sp.]
MINKVTDGLSARIYYDLKKKIEEFEIKPGDRISETALTNIYEVSRTPIKHGLARLENEGLIFVRPQIGTFVSKIDTVHI